MLQKYVIGRYIHAELAAALFLTTLLKKYVIGRHVKQFFFEGMSKKFNFCLLITVHEIYFRTFVYT